MDDWQPDQTENVEGRTAYLWIVPARVEGTWRWAVSGSGPRAYELSLQQQFQKVEGLVRLDGKLGQLRDVKLNGDEISFSVHEVAGTRGTLRRDFSGRVSGNAMQGVMKLPNGTGAAKWSAARAN